MRISEKTIELNFCAQANALARHRLIWFGLTQRQEAKYGFDACTKIGGRLLILQFKASNYILKNKDRRFYASHEQLTNLQRQTRAKRSIFYVFPMVGTTLEMAMWPDLLSISWLMDVTCLPQPMPAPTGRTGALRRTGIHYVDVTSVGHAVIRSKPVNADVILARDFFLQDFPDSAGLSGHFENHFEGFWEFRHALSRNALGLIVVPDM